MNCYQKFYTNQIHSSSLLCQLATMWKSQVLCDAIIRTGQSITKAHRVILVAACPMLQSMENAAMGSHLEVRLAADIKQDSINTFLQYLYEGFMMLTEENCKDVEKIARLLQVDSVMKCCNDFYKCLSVKTGHTFCASDQYKFSSYDMLEFRHVRSSDIQKTVQDRMMKRGSDFTRPTSPSSKRQRMHKPASPSLDILGASHRADDTLSMAHSYGGPAPEPWDRVPRLGAGIRHNVSSQPGIIDIVEDSIEIIQTEHPDKDARGHLRPDARVKQKRESIAVSSQMNSAVDVQIVNVSDKNDSSSSKQNSTNSNTNATVPSNIGRGSITVSPLSMFNDTSSAIPVARSSALASKPQSHSSPDVPVPDVQSVQRSNDSVVSNSLSQPVFPTSISPVSRMPPMSLAKPFAAGSAQQAGDTPSSKVQRSEDSQNEQEKNVPSPALFDKEQENSGKIDGESSRLSADKAPDISIVKIEQEDDNTGGLDMYVDIPEDGVMRIRRGLDDTEHEEGSDMEHDVMREEASNEGSNISGDQNNSWYIGQFKGPDSEESFQIMGNSDGGIEDGVMYRRGGDHVSDMQTVSNAVDIFRGWLKEKNFQTAFEMYPTEELAEKVNQFHNESTLSGSKMETLSMMKDSLSKYIDNFRGVPEAVVTVPLEPALNLQDNFRGSQSTKVSKKTPMTITDLIQLHHSQLLSPDMPVSLFRKVWFDVSLHLGCCGQDAMRQLHARSFILEADEYGRKFYRLNQDINDAKTRSRHEMQCWNWDGRMYECPDDPTCPVKSLTLYLSKRNQNNEAFFQRHKVGFSPTDSEWYEAAPLGHCLLARIMSVMSEEAGLSKIYTNTSLRLTAANFLDDYQLDTHRILGVHPRYKSLKALRKKEQHSSDVLHNDSTALHNIMYCS